MIDHRIPQETFDYVIKSHNSDMQAAIERGSAYWAGFYARQAVHYYLMSRAYSIATEKRRAIKTAFEIARNDIYGSLASPIVTVGSRSGNGDVSA